MGPRKKCTLANANATDFHESISRRKRSDSQNAFSVFHRPEHTVPSAGPSRFRAFQDSGWCFKHVFVCRIGQDRTLDKAGRYDDTKGSTLGAAREGILCGVWRRVRAQPTSRQNERRRSAATHRPERRRTKVGGLELNMTELPPKNVCMLCRKEVGGGQGYCPACIERIIGITTMKTDAPAGSSGEIRAGEPPEKRRQEDPPALAPPDIRTGHP